MCEAAGECFTKGDNMSAICVAPSAVIGNGVKSMTDSTLRPDLQEIVKDILALRAMAKKDHFLTHRSQRKILARLNAKDLAVVARAISDAERTQVHQ